MRPEITKKGLRLHRKASEEYIDVIFKYNKLIWDGSIPIKYRRTGLELNTDAEIDNHLEEAYEACRPENHQAWLNEQRNFWDTKPNAEVTKSFFDKLSSFKWCCVVCDLPPNPNWARRIQDIKEFGYTLATDTAHLCTKCNTKNTHLLLVPLPRGGITGYEVWSPGLRARIIQLHKNYDAYEGKNGQHLLPDHKFPEIRWDLNTKRDSLSHLSDNDILKDFQLLSNQRNQQKREVCRSCFQTGRRGFPFGIKFYYQGTEMWPDNIQKKGKQAENGCVGCGWYDMKAWRDKVTEILEKHGSG